MIVRGLRLLAAGLFFFCSSAFASPSFDCTKVTSVADKAVCSSAYLSALDQDMAPVYNHASLVSGVEDRRRLVLDQRQWLVRREIECPAGDGQEACLGEVYKARLQVLKTWSPGKPPRNNGDADIIMIEDTPEAERVCEAIFDRRNMAWGGLTSLDGDHISVSLPKETAQVSWAEVGGGESYTLQKGFFDFRGAGKSETVYRLYHFGRGMGCCVDFADHYLVIDNAQDGKFYDAAFNADVDEDQDGPDVVQKIIDQEHELRRSGHDVNATVHRLFNRTSPLYSMTGTEDRYDGVVTKYEGFAYGGKYYFLSRQAMLLVRPNKTGTFDSLCTHKPLASHRERRIDAEKSNFPCPVKGTPKQKGTLELNPFTDPFLDLAEWGGRRPVLAGCEMISRIECRSWVQVGAAGAEKVSHEKDPTAWEPLQKVLEDYEQDAQVNLYLTDGGPYVGVYEGEFNTRSTTDYYRIADGGLAEVCSVTDQVVGPAGYRHATK